MAVEKTITQSAEIVALPFGMPRVEMPLNAALNDRGYVVFVLDTAAGPVHVKAYWEEFECRGKAPALIAAGLTRPEWFPGLPGNQKTRQRVLFDSTGMMRMSGVKEKSKQPHITVCRNSPCTFTVEVPATSEQCKRLEVFHKQRDARDAARIDRIDREERDRKEQERLLNRSPEELRGSAIYSLELFESLLSRAITKGGVNYADDVVVTVATHVDAIRQAILGGKILPVSLQYQRDGNVVFLPGMA